MERQVGEIFEYNGEWYQCIEGTGCYRCAFYDKNICIADNPHCTRRSDKKNVIFKKLEKVGEPYMSNGHLMQTLSGEKQPNSIRDYKTRMCYYANCILRIEIKQNKEDMEEKKLNFKPFDLEAAKAGKPVCTRDGRKARIICFDAKCNKPIVALIYDCNKETVLQYLENGRFFVDQIDKYDLMMFPQKKEGWVNVYKSYNVGKKIPCMASIYPTKEEAKKSSVVGFDYVDTVKIEWEE
nr:MAG TPA: hypothetical protein [Bacteriophage sp.]